MTIPLIIGGLAAFAGVWWGSGWVIKVSLRNRIFDYPNQRTLHHSPVPKGGGLAIGLSLLGGTSIWAFGDGITFPLSLAGAMAILWLTGLVEDYRRVPIKIRFPVQVIAALFVLYGGAPFQSLPLPEPLDYSLSLAAWPLNLFWLLAITNAFNFMDGIDGLAASHLPLIGGVLFLVPTGPLVNGLGFLTGAAGLAFLRWNRAPAKIFMGDSGAIPLGFLLGALPFYMPAHASETGVLIVALLLGLFLFDTGYTLIRRIIHKERIWEAHRSHLYQRLVISGLSHSQVTGLILIGSGIIASLIVGATWMGWTLWLPLVAVLVMGLGLIVFTQSRESNTKPLA